MKIPAEFEDIFHGVELKEKETQFLSWIVEWDARTIQNMRAVLEKVRAAGIADAPTLSALQTENERLRAELTREAEARKKQSDILCELRAQKYEQISIVGKLRDELKRAEAERDAAVERAKGFERYFPEARYN